MTEIRKWMIQAEDENGDTHELTENPIIGTWDECSLIAENLADDWEAQTGGLVLRLTLHSLGKVTG